MADDDGETIKMALKPDAYSAITFGLCRVFDYETNQKVSKSEIVGEFCVALSMHVLSVTMQFLLFLWLHFGSISESKKAYADADVKVSLFTNATSTNTSLAVTDPIMQHCCKDKAMAYAHLVMTFVWLLKMLGEIWASLRHAYVQMIMPNAHNKHDELLKYEHPEKLSMRQYEGAVTIVGVTPVTKAVLLLGVCLPKCVMAFLITYLGMEFLEFQAISFADLIMKSLALAFIATIDELIFGSLGPAKFKKEMKKAAFEFHESHYPHAWNIWGSTLCKAVIVVAACIIYCWVIHADISNLRAECGNYKDKFPDTCA